MGVLYRFCHVFSPFFSVSHRYQYPVQIQQRRRPLSTSGRSTVCRKGPKGQHQKGRVLAASQRIFFPKKTVQWNPPKQNMLAEHNWISCLCIWKLWTNTWTTENWGLRLQMPPISKTFFWKGYMKEVSLQFQQILPQAVGFWSCGAFGQTRTPNLTTNNQSRVQQIQNSPDREAGKQVLLLLAKDGKYL